MGPEERVTSWIADWHAAHQEAAPKTGAIDFARWGALVAAVDARHFVAGGSSGSSSSYGTPPEHAPQAEVIDAAVVDGDHATVDSRNASSYAFYGYRLQRVNGDWRIAVVRRYFDDKDAVVVKADKRDAVLGRADENAPFAPLPDGSVGPHPALFQPGVTLTLPGPTPTTLLTSLRAGPQLALPSGVVGVEDFGYGNDFFPLHRRVPPGRYRVEACVVVVGGNPAHERVAGVRVVFSEAAVAAWHPANIKDSGHVIGVDAGNVAIFDGGNYVGLNKRKKEDLYNEAIERLPMTSMTMKDAGDAVMVSSGWGDGGYPAYWGVDAAGAVAVLVVDFCVLPDPDNSTTR